MSSGWSPPSAEGSVAASVHDSSSSDEASAATVERAAPERTIIRMSARRGRDHAEDVEHRIDLTHALDDVLQMAGVRKLEAETERCDAVLSGSRRRRDDLYPLIRDRGGDVA